jgi:hypothetical protein
LPVEIASRDRFTTLMYQVGVAYAVKPAKGNRNATSSMTLEMLDVL